MNRAPFFPGAPGRRGDEGLFFGSRMLPASHGFTLLEMVIVLLIFALIAGICVPAWNTAVTEQAVRKDSHQLALMVKTAMIQAAEQHRPYVIDLSATTALLHPQGTSVKADDTLVSEANLFASSDSAADASPGLTDVSASDTLESANKLQVPDVTKLNAWIDMPENTSWVFQPGRLCPATRIRLSRGESWLEMSFNSLTGNVENERTSFP